MLVNYLLVTKIYKGKTKNIAVINPAKAIDWNKIETAVLRSAFLSSGDWTLDIWPNFPKLNVPANPYAKQNFLRDWTNPIEKIRAGIKIDNLFVRLWLVASSAVALEKVKKIPIRATNWRRLISPLPMLHEPGIYSVLN